MSITRNNHYVPEWYQKEFLLKKGDLLHYLDLSPPQKVLPDGRIIELNSRRIQPPSKCFCEIDLYTTTLGPLLSDVIEKRLFGDIDTKGAKATRALIANNLSEWTKHYSDFFLYLNAQKIRSPKGLDWIKQHYHHLSQNNLMKEMLSLRSMHCTIWSESVQEIISAKNSNTKFIISDHPVTIYNPKCPSNRLKYPNDPPIVRLGSQTIFILDQDNCLILTNYEYAQSPNIKKALKERSFAKMDRDSIARTDLVIRERYLSEEEVIQINYIIKQRARKYIAAAKKEWLYPEKYTKTAWHKLQEVLLPPKEKIHLYGGETYIGFDDGTVLYQDQFGRPAPENPHLKKHISEKTLKPNSLCGCGMGKRYKDCCKNTPQSKRPSWAHLSIRERNIAFSNAIADILKLPSIKNWDNIRRNITNEQVSDIYRVYATLWPLETNLIKLLPKSSNASRAVYTGIIDARKTPYDIMGLTPYFDEIIIQSPFLNPNCLKPGFNPINEPQKHKQQFLRDIYLFLSLFPFIDDGKIHLVPDPCIFSEYLRNQINSIHTHRLEKEKISPQQQDEKILSLLKQNNNEHFLYSLPKEDIYKLLQQRNPKASKEEINLKIQKLEQKILNDPIALLQQNKLKERVDILNISPNFEISLLLAQLSGSFLLTDSQYRWQEITKQQYRQQGMIIYNWSDLTDFLNNQEQVISYNTQVSLELARGKNSLPLKNHFKNLYTNIIKNNYTSIKRLKREHKKALDTLQSALDNTETDDLIKIKLQYLIPDKGIVSQDVTRAIIQSGHEINTLSVPAAIFIDMH